MKNRPFFKTIIKTVLLSLVLSMSLFQFQVLPVNAAVLTSLSDTMSRLKISTASNHEIKFVTPSGVSAGKNIQVTFPSDFNLNSIDYLDMDLAEGDSNDCSTAVFTDKTLAALASGATWGAAYLGQVVTFTSDTDTITADHCVQIEIGTNATEGGIGDTQIVNATTTGSKTISIGGTMADSGSLAVGLISDDQVVISGTVDPSFSFSISSNTCALNSGTALTSGNANVYTCSYTITTNTNATNGYVTTMMPVDDGSTGLPYALKQSGDVDATKVFYNVSDGFVSGSQSTGSEYGVSSSDTDMGGGGEVAITSPDCNNDTNTSIAGTNIYTSYGGNPVTVKIAEASSEGTETVTICHEAAPGVSQPESGSYSETVILISTGNF